MNDLFTSILEYLLLTGKKSGLFVCCTIVSKWSSRAPPTGLEGLVKLLGGLLKTWNVIRFCGSFVIVGKVLRYLSYVVMSQFLICLITVYFNICCYRDLSVSEIWDKNVLNKVVYSTASFHWPESKLCMSKIDNWCWVVPCYGFTVRRGSSCGFLCVRVSFSLQVFLWGSVEMVGEGKERSTSTSTMSVSFWSLLSLWRIVVWWTTGKLFSVARCLSLCIQKSRWCKRIVIL